MGSSKMDASAAKCRILRHQRDCPGKNATQTRRTAAHVAEELALYYVGIEWHKADQRWATSGFNQSFFVLSDGLIGMGPMVMEADDMVVILRGGPVPYVLRPFGDEYMFVGEYYVYGAMYWGQCRDV